MPEIRCRLKIDPYDLPLTLDWSVLEPKEKFVFLEGNCYFALLEQTALVLAGVFPEIEATSLEPFKQHDVSFHWSRCLFADELEEVCIFPALSKHL